MIGAIIAICMSVSFIGVMIMTAIICDRVKEVMEYMELLHDAINHVNSTCVDLQIRSIKSLQMILQELKGEDEKDE